MFEWFLYRPVLENKVTMTELKTILTISEVLKINALLDMESDMKAQAQEQQDAQIRTKGR